MVAFLLVSQLKKENKHIYSWGHLDWMVDSIWPTFGCFADVSPVSAAACCAPLSCFRVDGDTQFIVGHPRLPVGVVHNAVIYPLPLPLKKDDRCELSFMLDWVKTSSFHVNTAHLRESCKARSRRSWNYPEVHPEFRIWTHFPEGLQCWPARHLKAHICVIIKMMSVKCNQ